MKSITLNRYSFKGAKKYLIPFGDFHYGSNFCNVEKIKEWVQWIKDNDAIVILMGDLIESASRYSVGAGVYEQNIPPNEQINGIVEILTPIRKQIIGLHIGNHEYRIYKETGIDVSERIARELRVSYLGWGCFHRIKVGKISYTVYSTHGSTGSTTPHTKIKSCLRLGESFDADIYLYGHVHEIDSHVGTFQQIDLRNKKLIEKKRFFALTGHYLNYKGSYAEMKNMQPGKQGSPRIRLDGEKLDVHISL